MAATPRPSQVASRRPKPFRIAAMGRPHLLREVIRSLAIFCIVVAVATPLFGNLWSLATGVGWHVPAESSVFTFTETRGSGGSAEWWSAGEDSRNYYTLDPEADGYLVIARADAARCRGFDRFDASTWCRKRP